MKISISVWACVTALLLICTRDSAEGAPTVEVLRPNGSDRLQPGTMFRVQWRTQGLGTNIDWSLILFTNDVRLVPFLSLPGRVYDEDADGNWHVDVLIPTNFPSSCDYTLMINDDGSEANDHSDVFCLGVPVLTVRVSQVEVCWSSRSNRVYQVQHRSPLSTNGWTNLGAPIQGNGSTNCVMDAVGAEQRERYYRVEELP